MDDSDDEKSKTEDGEGSGFWVRGSHDKENEKQQKKDSYEREEERKRERGGRLVL